MEDESIKKILETTGLSCDALLEKLKEYKLIASRNDHRGDKNNTNFSEKNSIESEEKSSTKENVDSESPQSGAEEEAVEVASDVPEIYPSHNLTNDNNALDIDENQDDCSTTSTSINHTAEDLNPELGNITSNDTHEEAIGSNNVQLDSPGKSDDSKNEEIQPTTNESTEEVGNVIANEGISSEENVESTTLEPSPDVGNEIQHTSDTLKYQIKSSTSLDVSCNEISSTESDDIEDKNIPENLNLVVEAETCDNVVVDSDEAEKNDKNMDEGIVSSSVHADISTSTNNTDSNDGKEHTPKSSDENDDDDDVSSNNSEAGKLQVDISRDDNDDIFYEDEDEENALINSNDIAEADENGMPDSDNSMEGERRAPSSHEDSDSEDIRNILKLQLNTLRSKRKDEFKIDSIISSASPLLNRNPKKKLFPESLFTGMSQETEDLTSKNLVNNENIIETTEDCGFLISDVVGGVDMNESETKSSIEEEEDSKDKLDHEMIKLTKTTDITKIKGWKRKKFSSALEDDECSESVNPVEAIRKIISKRDGSESNKNAKPEDVSENTVSLSRESSFNNADVSNNSTDSDRIEAQNCINLSEIQPRQEQLNANSPFVSNTLDEFLNSNAKLNISYQVPMLYAVEGIGVCKQVSPTSQKVIRNSDDRQPGNKSSLKLVPAVKAKTLAEKRRILEQINKKKRKETKKKWEKSRQSYVMYEGKEIWLTSRSNEVYLGTINDSGSKKSEKIESPFKRPSLLNSLQEKIKQTVKYKAGPLSKKNDLQDNESKKYWETVIKKLPQVYLEVVPGFRRAIPDEIRKFMPNFDTHLNDVRTEFALSALINKKSEKPKVFRVPVPYSKSVKNIIVRRKRSFNESIEEPVLDLIKSRIEPSSVEEEVENIIEDLLKYIEIKEISESLIKDDETNKDGPDPVDQPLLKNNCKELGENISTFFRKTKRKSKVDYELSRLNCKVVNVTVEKDDNSNCRKPFCKLGCVCQSLACANIFSFHCKKVDCMFECTCPKQRYQGFDDDILLPAGTDLFSQDAVNRISDQAKRNLAKEEKEFTQTIIYANNQAIIVGSSNGRASARRMKRPPKKFTDFEDPDKVDSDFVHKVDPKMTRKCTVMLRKLNLDKLVPLCLEHYEYDCFCDNKTAVSSKSNKESASDTDTTKTEPLGTSDYLRGKISRHSETPRKRYSGMDASSDQEERPRKRKREEISKAYVTLLPRNSVPKVPVVEEPVDTTCARIREVFPSYKLRNKTPEFWRILHNKLKAHDRNHHIGPVPGDLKLEVVESGSNSSAENLQNYINAVITAAGSGLHLVLNKADKKNQFKIIEKPKLPQPQPKLPVDATLNSTAPIVDSTAPIFDGEEIITKANDEQFFQKNLVLKNSRISTVRILPWNCLVQGLMKKSLYIAQTITKQPDLYVNSQGLGFPPGAFRVYPTNCRKNISDVLKFIFTKKNPLEDPRILLYAVLIPFNSNCFHFNALYLKNLKTNQKYVFPDLKRYNSPSFSLILNGLAQQTFKDSISTQLVAVQNPQKQTETEVTNSLGEESSTNTTFHKNLKGELCFLSLTKHNLDGSIQFEEINSTEDASSFLNKDRSRDPSELTFALPRTNLLWRMIYLTDFTYLSLVKSNNYVIKCTDLVTALNMSKDMSLTISLSSGAVRSGYHHPKFGIYFTPNHADKIFIGPYHENESHGIETLRYMQNELVKADVLDAMLGKMNRTGVWLREKNSSTGTSTGTGTSTISTANNASDTIDLTEDAEEVDVEELDEDKTLNQSERLRNQPNDPSPIDSNEQTEITDPDPAESFEVVEKCIPEGKVNRYIVSNVPHLGHIRAMFDELSKAVYLFWNLTGEVLKFSAWSKVFAFIEKRLRMYILPVPETFKMKFAVLVSPNVTEKHPISRECLKGFYIYGEFGILNVTSITREFLKKFDIDRDDIVKRLTKRAQKVISDKAVKLGSFLFPRGSPFDVEKVLVTATEEIKYLRRTEAALDTQIKNLLSERCEKVQRLESVLKDLPEDVRSVEASKYQSYMRLSRKRKRRPQKSDSNLTKQSGLSAADSQTNTPEGISQPNTAPTTISGFKPRRSIALLNDKIIEVPLRLPATIGSTTQGPLTTSKADERSPDTIPKLLPFKTAMRGRPRSSKTSKKQTFIVVTRDQTNSLLFNKKPVTAVVERNSAEVDQLVKEIPVVAPSKISNQPGSTEEHFSDHDDDISIVEAKPEVIEISDSDEETQGEDKASPPRKKRFLPLDSPQKVLKFSNVFGDNVKLKRLPSNFDLDAVLKSPTRLPSLAAKSMAVINPIKNKSNEANVNKTAAPSSGASLPKAGLVSSAGAKITLENGKKVILTKVGAVSVNKK